MDTLSFCCSTCKLDKPATEFHKNKSRKRGFSGECKLCVITRMKAAYAANPEKYRQRRRDWYAADPEKARAAVREYRQRSPEAAKASQKKYKAANKDKIKVAERAWVEKNRETVLARNRQKRAQKRNAVSEPYTKDDILQRWGSDCHICGEPIDFTASRRRGKGLQLDHVIPLSKGGPDTISNVKPAHAFCNTSKKDKLIQ